MTDDRRPVDRERGQRLRRSVRRIGESAALLARTGPIAVVDRVHVGDGTIDVSGHVRAGLAPELVAITVDDVPFGTAVLGPPTTAGRGFTFSLPRERLTVGPHRLRAVVVLAHSVSDHSPTTTFTVPPVPRMIGALDLPSAGAELPGSVVRVRGWVDTAAGVDRVELDVDDVAVGRVRLMAVPRPDLVGVVPGPEAPLAGWESWIDLGTRVGTHVTIRARAVGEQGERVLGVARVTVVPPTIPAVDRERLATLRTRTDDAVARRAASDAAALGEGAAPGARPDLHVLVCTHSLGLGGGQLFLQEYLDRMHEQGGIRMTVLSGDDGPLRDRLERMGVMVQVVGQAPLDALGFEQWLRDRVATLDGEPDVVVANTLLGWWGVVLADRLAAPSTWIVHESYTPAAYLDTQMPTRADAAVRDLFLGAFGTASVVLFEAEETRALFADVVPADRALVRSYGIDLSDAVASASDPADDAARRARLGLPPTGRVLLCIGSFEPRKAQGLLAAAFDRIAAAHPDTVLALVGAIPTPYTAAVQSLVERSVHADRIRVLDVTPDIADWYSVADAFVLVSDLESLPRSMMEAMADGIPILGTTVFGVPSLVHDGEDGVLVAPNDIRAIAAGLDRFLAMDAAEVARLGRHARDRAHAEYSSAVHAVTFRAMLEALAGRS